MAQMSDYLEENLVNLIFRNTTFSSPGTIYIALYSADPGEDDTGTELLADGYTRISTTFLAPADGVTSNINEIVFPAATADWATITHVGVRDAETAGNLLMHQMLDSSISILAGNNFRIPAGELEITFA